METPQEGSIVRRLEREQKDYVLSGVLIALAIVYSFDADPTSTLAQEIVGTVGAADLLRVAKQEEDYILPKLRKTARSLGMGMRKGRTRG